MSCNHPLKGFKTGHFTESGKDEIYVSSANSEWLSFDDVYKRFHHYPVGMPTAFKGQQMFLTESIPIPCGVCVSCRMAHAKEWMVRCCLERQLHLNSYFITLTYDGDHLPKDRLLHKEHLQCFLKRLRKHFGHFRYFACGEYGETYDRPHFHLIAFGLNIPDLKEFCVTSRSVLYRSAELTKIWGNGFVSIGYADNASIAYTAGYVEKKAKRVDDHAVPPFLTMSRKPAIGSHYLLDHGRSIMSTGKVYGDFGKVHHHRAPRHFLRKLEDLDPYAYNGKKIQAQERAQRYIDLDHVVWNCSDDDYLGFVKDEVMLQKLNEVKRS